MSEVILVKRPAVARPPRPTPVAAVASTFALAGLGIFLWLSDARAAQADRDTALPPLAATSAPSDEPGPPPTTAAIAPQPTAFPFIPNSKTGPVTLVATPAPYGFVAVAPSASTSTSTADRARERLRAPALIIDLAQADVPRPPGAARSDSGLAGPGAPAPVPAPAGNDRNLSDTERFASRVGNEEVEVATAQRMTGLNRLVPQGAIIGAVMETALNSDLPGFARALTQRDVYSFDGSAVMIPAGSRVIGQYKSGVAQGASRVFILWTRLIRPDGVSIELASPAVDELGRGGVGGKVNRHFLQRFGGAILLSVLSGGISAAVNSLSGGSTIVVGSAGEASSLAGQATRGTDIPPTITTRQGATVRIFVARDLDFTRVGPMQ